MPTDRPTILIDSREQTPLVFSGSVATRVVGLRSGDYAIEPPRESWEPRTRPRRRKRGKADPTDTAPPLTANVVTDDGVIESVPHAGHVVELAPPRIFAAVERKSLDDLVGCVVGEREDRVGGGRERFERELARLSAYQHKAIVVEASLGDVWLKQSILGAEEALKARTAPEARRRLLDQIERWRARTYRANVSPAAVEASCAAWQLRFGVPTIWAGSPEGAARWVERFLLMAWRYRQEMGRRSVYGAVKPHVGVDGEAMPCGDGI